MKICCCINSLNPGGKERVMSELINGFIKYHKAEVHVVVYGTNDEIFYKIDENAIIYRPDFIFDDSKRFLYTLKTLRFLRRKVKKINPDVVLSFGEIWNSFVLLALLGTRIPVYISDRCQPNKSFGFFQDTLKKWLYPKAKGVIAQTQQSKVYYNQQYKHNNIVVIGNPFHPIDIPSELERENVVVSVGRLIDTKHYDQLIDIFAQINKTDWRLIIVGGDAIKQHNKAVLQEQIDRLGLRDNIKLVGTQKNVNDYLLKAKIFAFTSSSEGFPNAIGEAMEAGLPAVAYNCIAGPSDLIHDGENGFLIPLYDKKLFSEKLRLLMEDETLLFGMGKKAILSMEKYSVENIVNDYYNAISIK